MQHSLRFYHSNIFTVSACKRWARLCAHASACNYPTPLLSVWTCWASLDKDLWQGGTVGWGLWHKCSWLTLGGRAGRQLWHGQKAMLGKIPNRAGWKTGWTDDRVNGLIEAQIKPLPSTWPCTCSDWDNVTLYSIHIRRALRHGF